MLEARELRFVFMSSTASDWIMEHQRFSSPSALSGISDRAHTPFQFYLRLGVFIYPLDSQRRFHALRKRRRSLHTKSDM